MSVMDVKKTFSDSLLPNKDDKKPLLVLSIITSSPFRFCVCARLHVERKYFFLLCYLEQVTLVKSYPKLGAVLDEWPVYP